MKADGKEIGDLKMKFYPAMVPHDSKSSKYICILMLCFSVPALAAAVVLRHYSFFVLFLITGVFALIYGGFWAFWTKKEKKKEQEIREIEEAKVTGSEPDPLALYEFILPREQLKKAAFKRVIDVLKWVPLVALIMTAVITGTLVFYGETPGIGQCFGMLLFCMIVGIPGIIIQFVINKAYTAELPRKVVLYPGKLVVDGEVMAAGEIREIRVSPKRMYNYHSPKILRGMTVKTGKGKRVYQFDFWSGRESADRLCWAEYPAFVDAVTEWGRANHIAVVIEYME